MPVERNVQKTFLYYDDIAFGNGIDLPMVHLVLFDDKGHRGLDGIPVLVHIVESRALAEIDKLQVLVVAVGLGIAFIDIEGFNLDIDRDGNFGIGAYFSFHYYPCSPIASS